MKYLWNVRINTQHGTVRIQKLEIVKETARQIKYREDGSIWTLNKSKFETYSGYEGSFNTNKNTAIATAYTHSMAEMSKAEDTIRKCESIKEQLDALDMPESDPDA